MCSRCLNLLLSITLVSAAQSTNALRVCADPNNMPFSNEAGQGLENKLAQLVASDLAKSVQYIWWAQRKSFIKNSLNENKCDVLMGVPSSLDSVSVTKPYYRSSYVFVSRRDRSLHVSSLLDPRLAGWRIGINVVGDDYAPPAYALARQGVTQNIVPFSSFAEPGVTDPARKIIQAIDRGDIDVAIVWGPIAGYFGKQSDFPLVIEPVVPPVFAGVPFSFDISMGVRLGDESLKASLDRIIQTESAAIGQILSEYAIPQVH